MFFYTTFVSLPHNWLGTSAICKWVKTVEQCSSYLDTTKWNTWARAWNCVNLTNSTNNWMQTTALLHHLHGVQSAFKLSTITTFTITGGKKTELLVSQIHITIAPND